MDVVNYEYQNVEFLTSMKYEQQWKLNVHHTELTARKGILWNATLINSGFWANKSRYKDCAVSNPAQPCTTRTHGGLPADCRTNNNNKDTHWKPHISDVIITYLHLHSSENKYYTATSTEENVYRCTIIKHVLKINFCARWQFACSQN